MNQLDSAGVQDQDVSKWRPFLTKMSTTRERWPHYASFMTIVILKILFTSSELLSWGILVWMTRKMMMVFRNKKRKLNALYIKVCRVVPEEPERISYQFLLKTLILCSILKAQVRPSGHCSTKFYQVLKRDWSQWSTNCNCLLGMLAVVKHPN